MAKSGTLFGKPRGDVIKHPGAFSAKAAKAGKSTAAYARQVTKEGSKASTQTKRQANLAKTFAKLRAGKAKFVVPLVLAALVATANAANLTCPSGSLTPTPITSTTNSANTVMANAKPAIVFQATNTAGTATAEIDICCVGSCDPVTGTWAQVQNSPMTLTVSSGAVGIGNPTCLYRALVTACSTCSLTVAYVCSGP